jgi:hypothetical protein
MKNILIKGCFVFAALTLSIGCKKKSDLKNLETTIETPTGEDNTSTDYTVPLEYSINGEAKKGSILVSSQANPYFCPEKTHGGAVGFIKFEDTKFSFTIDNFKPEGGVFSSVDHEKPNCEEMTLSAIIDDKGNQYTNAGGTLILSGKTYTLKHETLAFHNGPGSAIKNVSLVATWTKP